VLSHKTDDAASQIVHFVTKGQIIQFNVQNELAVKANPDKVLFDTIVMDLMKDRLTEIAKYIVFEQSLKEIHIDSERLQRDGYTLTVR